MLVTTFKYMCHCISETARGKKRKKKTILTSSFLALIEKIASEGAVPEGLQSTSLLKESLINNRQHEAFLNILLVSSL